ncbi:MAG: hypothetical protein AAGJ46_08700 [Planctomycetota bacterium]
MAACLTLGLACGHANSQTDLSVDPFVFYFGGNVGLVGDVGGATFDANGDFWVAGRNSSDANIRKVSFNGSSWASERFVPNADWKFFYRSADLTSGFTEPDWAGPTFGTPASFLLNPAPLTVDVPLVGGGTTQVTYGPGELAFISDDQGPIGPNRGSPDYSATKRLYRYDLRKIDATTDALPDFDNASNGSDPDRTVFGGFNNADWNDVFAVVLDQETYHLSSSVLGDYNGDGLIETADFTVWRDSFGQTGADLPADGNGNGEVDTQDYEIWRRNYGNEVGGFVGGSDLFGRSFAWSSDGQSIYMVEAASNYGGIYRIDPTGREAPVLLKADRGNISGGPDRIQAEPAVVPTSVFDFEPDNPATGDQLIMEGSLDGGNNGGMSVYLDQGPFATDSAPIFTEAQFREFAEYEFGSFPEYPSLTADSQGNLYIYEQTTDMVFRYDTQGRFVKVFSEAEHNELQEQFRVDNGNSDIVSDMQIRTSNAAGFPLTELIFVDDIIDAPVGVLIYEVGDFDRDGDVEADDLALFSAALTVRGEAAEVADWKFDLNGAPITAFDADDQRFEPVSNGPTVVDWKDVTVLQQFIDLPTGDADFDGDLDLADVDIVEENYFTLGGPADKVWRDGDFGSIDPRYAKDAADANLVDQTDLQLLADAWVLDEGQAPITAAEATGQGYSGQFLDDLLAAFAITLASQGDFNGDGVVDAADYTVWRDNLGQTGDNLLADADRNQVVDTDDFAIWRSAFGAALFSSATAAVPEPSTLLLAAGLFIWPRRRGV